MKDYTLHVSLSSTRPAWGVYVHHGPARKGTLLEGGFFSRVAALEAKDLWATELLNSEVELAERKAGWDGTP